jgi:hypothetical protein
MAVIYKKAEAKVNGFAQVRKAMTSFVGDVVSAVEGKWDKIEINEKTGLPKPPKEYVDISCENVEVLATNEPLSMPITEWNFRINTSEAAGSFWVDKFLDSAERNKVELLDGMVGKRIVFTKDTLVNKIATFNKTDWVIEKVVGEAGSAPQAVPNTATASKAVDLMEVVETLAIGKTEAQFKSAVGLHPAFVGNPMLAVAKTGALTASLVASGKLIEVQEGTKKVYRKP